MANARPTQTTTLHFGLRHSGAEDCYQLHHGGKRTPLVMHDDQSLKLACETNAAFAAMAPEQRAGITHYIEDIELPADVPAHYYVTKKVPGLAINELAPLSLSFIHIPDDAMEACRRASYAETKKVTADARFVDLGIEISEDFETMLAIQSGLDQFKNPYQAAYAVINQHPQLASQDKDTAARVMNNHIVNAEDIGGLVTVISNPDPEGWAISTPSVNHKGELLTWSDKWGDRNGKTVYHYKLADKTANALVTPTSAACTTSQNDLNLKNKKWSVNQGKPNEPVAPSGPTSAIDAAQADIRSSFVLNNKTPGHGLEFQAQTINYVPDNDQPTSGTFSINIVNSFLRNLWAWVQYLDSAGNVIDSCGNPAPPDHYEQIGLGVVNSVNTILAIPIPSAQGLSFPWPEKAASVRIINAGLGQNVYNGQLAWRGILLTVLFQYCVPIILLAAGALLERGDYYKKWTNNKIVLELLLSAIEAVVGSEASQGPSLDNGIGVLAGFENGLAGFIVSTAAGRIAAFIVEKTAEAEVIDSVPIVGWIARVASMVITAASILETTIEVATSPSIYDVEVKRIVVLEASVLPDPITGTPEVPATWPPEAIGGHYLFQIQYKDGTNYSQTGSMPDVTSQDPIIGKFPQLPAGGKFQIIFGVYSEDNWLAGKWTSGWTDALPPEGGGPLKVQGAIIQSLAKLTVDTQYKYVQSLRFEDDAHIWKADVKPTAVVKDLGTTLYQSSQITINDKAYMLGYVWQAKGLNIPVCGSGTADAEACSVEAGDANDNILYAFQNINIGAHPQASLKFPSCGFTGKPALIYDQFGPAPLLSIPLSEGSVLDAGTISSVVKAAFVAVDKTLPKDAIIKTVTETAEWSIAWPELQNPAYILRRSPIAIEAHAYPSPTFSQRNFYVDPRDGEFHLRHVVLDNSTAFDMTEQLSWGRFNAAHLDAFAIHPAGYAVGVSFSYHRLEVIKLPSEGTADKNAQLALTLAGKGQRQGLLLGPNALTVASDGRIMVMETGNQRVQAFDINGNPVPSFDGPSVTTMSADGIVPVLETKHVPIAMRESFAAASVHLSARWTLAVRGDQIQVDRDDAQLAIRRDGADLSTNWTIKDSSGTYSLKLVDASVMVEIPGTSGFALPAGSQSALDRDSVTSEIVAAFAAQSITLTGDAKVSGNGLFIPADGPEAVLARGQIPAELMAALATRGIQLQPDTPVHDALEVAITRKGKEWIIRDAPHANSYKVSLSGDATSLAIVDYLPFFALHNPQDRSFTSLSSELKGYIYILSYQGDGSNIADYALDIHEPNGSWLCATKNVNAAQLVVNQWRTVYTLDYQAFDGPGGRVEPSVSTWIPST